MVARLLLQKQMTGNMNSKMFQKQMQMEINTRIQFWKIQLLTIQVL